ncbi:phosphorylase family protein [Acetobacter oeni]|uniref:Purine phosphorylase n=1 Tax=Acetobacter oeni TaxID=304077 RepID=A0A511XIB1_9PROT|nr:hypothetical protein [Acetobacter oeni]MBB3883065.1 hopanoid-associated phosphorylase [Acetobacter oeni]NHO19140.1 hypothetical protein [Acetobacter oeni]GEN62651.1 purine phosphorylase [Acetobacter oeni]
MDERVRQDIGFLVGLKAESNLLRRFWPDAPIAISGASSAGAERGCARLVACGAKNLVSFGLAAGLDPALKPGTIVVPDVVMAGKTLYPCDPALRRRLGASPGHVTAGALLHSDTVVLDAVVKQNLAHESGCCALDMESGFIARTARQNGRSFAVLRAVCDPASRSLPPAAGIVLSPDGDVKIALLLRSLLNALGQIGGLVELGVDAFKARRAMSRFLTNNFPD